MPNFLIYVLFYFRTYRYIFRLVSRAFRSFARGSDVQSSECLLRQTARFRKTRSADGVLRGLLYENTARKQNFRAESFLFVVKRDKRRSLPDLYLRRLCAPRAI